jgi:hypothetical protein
MAANPQSTPKHLMSNKPVSGTFEDLGAVINTAGSDSVGLFLKMTIGTDSNFRIRAVGKLESTSADDYMLPIRTVSSSDIKIEAEYSELNVDSDQNIILEVLTDQLLPFVQFQVCVGTVGAGPAHAVVVEANTTEKNGRLR